MPKFRPLDSLSFDQAVDELAGLMDAKRDALDDPLEMHHWLQDFGARVRDLEGWILGHPQDPAPTPTAQSEPDQAPSIPEPAIQEPTPPPEPKPEPPTPALARGHSIQERLNLRIEGYLRTLTKLAKDPCNRSLRILAATQRNQALNLARRNDLPEPSLEDLPLLPERKAVVPKVAKELAPKVPNPAPKVPKPAPKVCPVLALHRKVVKVVISADPKECMAVLDDGSVLRNLTSIEAKVEAGALPQFVLAGRVA
jgi:hypothetical protein